jgi:Anti-sigma factor NepR
MANNGSAELKPGSQLQALHEDNFLFRQEKGSVGPNPPMLRIVYCADRVQEPSLDMKTASPRRPAPDQSGGMLDRTVQAQIGRMLREIFVDVASEPVPQRFVELLAALDTKENRK